ncbi:MAG: enoyl-ACP reductase FabI [Solirubrobacterales bacterium]|nr:enoyl-ACP reductase FabI [Solirubrobacterales bacterium]
MILADKRLLVTGVVNRHSIAYAIAERALEQGAEVMLTSFGRMRRMTERAAKRLPSEPEVLELDVNSDDDLTRLTADLGERWGRVDGAVHAIAHAPPDALGGNFVAAPRASAATAFETSAYSLKALAAALEPLMGPSNGSGPARASIVGLDFDASVAWPAYDWMGVAKAALESVARYLARDLGPRGVRVNLISAGPLSTPAASGIPGFEGLAAAWSDAAPLGWDRSDPGAVADAAAFLLSDLSRAISGEIIHVDGGYHALGAPGLAALERAPAGQSQ